jgi:thioredoxin 1
MKSLFKFRYLTLLAILFYYSCSNGQSNSGSMSLEARAFSDKISKMPEAYVIDVRTEEEFVKGHLPNAININWNRDDFMTNISMIDKNKPVFVYCLSEGFKEVYELQGGIMKWRASSLPEVTNESKLTESMSRDDFNKLLVSDKRVLINFYADWCAPCKKMKPYIDELSVSMSDSVSIIRINADEHTTLLKELGIDALPVLQLYQNNQLAWSKVGFTSKEELLQQLNNK